MKNVIELTLEQQFKLKVYVERIKLISLEESRILLVEIMRQNMIKDNVIKDLLNPKWTIRLLSVQAIFATLSRLAKFSVAAIEPYSGTGNKVSF